MGDVNLKPPLSGSRHKACPAQASLEYICYRDVWLHHMTKICLCIKLFCSIVCQNCFSQTTESFGKFGRFQLDNTDRPLHQDDIVIGTRKCSYGIWAQNMSESAIVAQRIYYDGVMNDGGLFKVEVDCQMIKYAKKAYGQYICLLH